MTTSLSSIDPDAPLDDLEPFRDVFAGAQVVGVGESAHGVVEFARFRHRLLRFLVERCGFTAFGLESGFSEGLLIDGWLRDGGAGEPPADGLTYGFWRAPSTMAQLAWMASRDVRYVGLDVPGSAASPLAGLAGVRGYLATADPAALPAVDSLIALVGRYADPNTLVAYAAYGSLSRAERDEVTARFAELSARLDVLAADTAEYWTARHELRLATLLDQDFRAYAGFVGGDPSRVFARDRGMAESAFWALSSFDGTLAIGAANSHLARTPVAGMRTLGSYLSDALGDGYVSVAVTTLGGRTTARRPSPSEPGGIALVSVDLDSPVAGSVEATMSGLGVLDVRDLRGKPDAPTSIRQMDGYLELPVADAFDFVVTLPTTS